MKTILFVDDEQLVLEGLGRLLREYRDCWKLLFALNGKEALKIVEKETPDMIISDIRMPEMNGLELLEKLQDNEKTKQIPVVILTGDQERSLKRQALDLGAVDLLNKPIYKEDLISRINNVLKLKEYQDIIVEKNQALEDQLVISQKMELVGVMAAGAVHDLSNLISIILGYSNLFIEENSLDKEDALSMAKIRQAGEKASDVVSQILKFSRQDEDDDIINLGGLIDEMLSIMDVAVPRGIKIKWRRPKNQVFLEGSTIKIQQVLMNLCINAVHAMGKKGKLTVSMKREPESNPPSVNLEVSDTGPGMDEATIKQIFNPLFTTKESGKGTGLGLFVVKHIVDEYHGSIDVDSRVGEGTTFRIRLPLDVE